MDNLDGPEFTDIMVDIETTGLMPDRTAILQIAAVKFNLKTGAICHQFFDRSLTIPQHRYWDPSTANWWGQQKAGLLQEIMSKAQPWEAVMREFGEYAYQNPGFRFWSKPTHFDFMFIQSYFHDLNEPNPFHYRVARDMNTYLEALFFPHEVPEEIMQLPFDGDAHNALSDTLHQLSMLLTAIEMKKKSIS